MQARCALGLECEFKGVIGVLEVVEQQGLAQVHAQVRFLCQPSGGALGHRKRHLQRRLDESRQIKLLKITKCQARWVNDFTVYPYRFEVALVDGTAFPVADR